MYAYLCYQNVNCSTTSLGKSNDVHQLSFSDLATEENLRSNLNI